MKKLWFTLIEILIVLIVIGVLSMGMMTYLGWNDERALMFKAEGCLTTIDGKVQNFLNYALTSKSFDFWGTFFSPDYYTILLSGTTNDGYNQFVLYGSTGESARQLIHKVSKSDCMNEFDKDFRFVISWTAFSWIVMSKGFRQVNPKDTFTFALTKESLLTGTFTGSIIVKVCMDDSGCKREIAKWNIDTRVQSIFLKKCLFYKEDSADECGEWEQ